MAYDPILEEGIKEMRAGATLQEAARFARVRDERLREYLVQTGVGIFEHGRWQIGPDRRPRRLPMYSAGRAIDIVVPSYEVAAVVGSFMSATGRFRATNDSRVLEPYRSKGVRDVKGVLHPFETDPNTLYRLMAAGPEPFEQIYRIVV